MVWFIVAAAILAYLYLSGGVAGGAGDSGNPIAPQAPQPTAPQPVPPPVVPDEMQAFASLLNLRRRLIACGASQAEIDGLGVYASILLREGSQE